MKEKGRRKKATRRGREKEGGGEGKRDNDVVGEKQIRTNKTKEEITG